MDAVILAAGLGTRLKEYTQNTCKCLISVHDKTILERQIEILVKCNVDHIYIVGGYCFSKLNEFVLQLSYKNIFLIENSHYLTTNNMYSLSLVAPYLKNKAFLLLNGDVLFEKEVIEGLLLKKNENVIAVDTSLYLEESMKVKVNKKRIYEISKTISANEAFGVSLDIYLFNAKTSTLLFNFMEEYLKIDKKSWSEVAIDAILKKEFFTYYLIHSKWVEIDTISDLKTALGLFD